MFLTGTRELFSPHNSIPPYLWTIKLHAVLDIICLVQRHYNDILWTWLVVLYSWTKSSVTLKILITAQKGLFNLILKSILKFSKVLKTWKQKKFSWNHFFFFTLSETRFNLSHYKILKDRLKGLSLKAFLLTPNCSRLRLSVGYFIYFKFTNVFFYLMFLMDVL